MLSHSISDGEGALLATIWGYCSNNTGAWLITAWALRVRKVIKAVPKLAKIRFLFSVNQTIGVAPVLVGVTALVLNLLFSIVTILLRATG